MHNALRAAPQYQVPSLQMEPDGSVLVAQWGEVGALLLRPGDRLLIERGEGPGLLVLLPRGYGRPMLGRRQGRGLLAEPGSVPASEQRWRVAGRVVAIERPLERVVALEGDWAVAARVEEGPRGRPIDALAAFPPGMRTGAELSSLAMRAALAPERFGVELALGAAAEPHEAQSLAEAAAPGTLRFALRAHVQAPLPAPEGRVIVGPWAERLAPRHPDHGVQLGLFGDSAGPHEP